MGQCASNKAKGNLSVKKIVSHKKSKKMDKHKQFREPKEDDNKPYTPPGWKETNKPSDPNGKTTPPKYTKGVSMSFGFKRRPTPMMSNNSAAAWDTGTTRPDANGNKDDTNTNSLARRSTTKDRNLHKTSSSQKQSASITPKPSRFGFPQTTTERTNKVADIKSHPLPLHFGSAPQSRPGSRRTSPNTDHAPSRTFTRNITVGTRTEIVETHEMVKDGSEQRPVVRERLGELHTVKTGKFTFQTTKLPQPEPIRLIETKTAKTIANNNKRSARMLKLCENAPPKIELSNGDSGFGSNASGGLGDNDNVKSSPMCLERSSENYSIHERLQGSKRFSLLENSYSFSDVSTPPPLPKLPSAFNMEKTTDTNKENECKNIRDDYICKKTFLKSNTPVSAFLKSRSRNVLERDSSQSSSDQEWGNGGEAMADDDISLTLSPSRKLVDETESPQNKYSPPGLKPGSVAEAVLQTLLQPSASFEMIDSLKESMNLTLSEEDPNFAAVVMNNNTAALLDDEMLSPVESLLSSSETEDIVKKKTIVRSSSNSKDVNEKLTPSPPGTPSNATYSLSLSEDKDDFLIDDEIADQPELVFEEGNNAERRSLSQFNQKDLVPMSHTRTSSFNPDFSPLPLRKKKNMQQDTTNQGSFDSMSPCDSIGSEDLIMDYDVSHANDIDLWDRQSGSFPSLEGTPKPKFKLDEAIFNNKNGIKSTTPKHSLVNGTPTRRMTNSPNSLKSRISRRSSPECRSPRKSHFHPFGFQSMTYDPTSESLTLTRHNHSAIQQDIIGIKTMLLTLRRVLNESESHSSLKNCTEEQPDNTKNNSYNNNNNNNDKSSEFRFELDDLRRQVEFLQGQLEDREKTVTTLQKQIYELATQNTYSSLDNAPTHLDANTQNRCNAATQTERARPLSTGVFSLTASPIEDNNPILRLMVK